MRLPSSVGSTDSLSRSRPATWCDAVTPLLSTPRRSGSLTRSWSENDARLEVDVLLADGGEVGHRGVDVLRDLRAVVDLQLHLDAAPGERHRADPPDGDAPLRDFGVGEDATGSGQRHAHGVGAALTGQ